MPTNYPTCDDVVRVVVVAYNERACELGHGPMASASIPVKIADVMDASMRGGGTPLAAGQCRTIAAYTMYHNIRLRDPFGGEGRFLSGREIGRYFGRTQPSIHNALMSACRLLDDPRYRGIYDAATEQLKADGFDLCGLKKKGCTER